MTRRNRVPTDGWHISHVFENSLGVYRTISCCYTIKDRGTGAAGPRFICLTHDCLEHNREHICDHVVWLQQHLSENGSPDITPHEHAPLAQEIAS